MRCPYCSSIDNKVVDSRLGKEGETIRRRRECLKCARRFTTYERVEQTARLVVVKRDGSHVPFSRENILATGYNGTPSGIEHCLDRGCLREQLGIPSGERHEICRGLHAEQNAIIQAAKHGTNIEGATLYCTNQPCGICAKMIINAGIRKLIYEDGYPDQLAAEMIGESGLEVVQHKKNEARKAGG